MSTNGTQPKVQIRCPRCSQVYSVAIPRMEIFNNLRSSGAVASREKLSYCINAQCRQPVILVLVPTPEGALGWGTVAANDEAVKEIEGSLIVKPMLGLVQ